MSAQVNDTDTDVLFQPLALASGSCFRLLPAALLSILIPPTVAEDAACRRFVDVLSAVGQRLAGAFAAHGTAGYGVHCDARVHGPGVGAAKGDDTSLLFHPLALASGLRLPLMTAPSCRLLILRPSQPKRRFPGPSTQSPLLVTDWPAPSPVSAAPATVSVRCRTGRSRCQRAERHVTSLLFQPLAFAQAAAGLTFGAVMSMLIAVDNRLGAALRIVDAVAIDRE